MTARNFIGCLAVCLLFVSSAASQPPLLWKFAKGQVFQAERSATQNQAVELNGKLFEQRRRSTWHIRLQMKEMRADNFVVQATLAKVEHRLTGGNQAEQIDPKLADKMQGSTFFLEVTPRGQIAKLHGYQEYLQRLAGDDRSRVKSLEATFPEPALQEALADLFGPLPPASVAKWQREYLEPIPHFGTLRSTASYTRTGLLQGLDRITYTLQTKYEAPAKDDRRGLFRIVKGGIETEKGTGTITFDRRAGHLVDHERTVSLRGTLAVEAMDRRQALTFRDENVVTVRLTPGK